MYNKSQKYKNIRIGGGWLVQWVEHETLDLKFMSLSLMLGIELTFLKKNNIRN